MDEPLNIEQFAGPAKLLMGKQFIYCDSIVKKFICK
jgi:hypothetical protein